MEEKWEMVWWLSCHCCTRKKVTKKMPNKGARPMYVYFLWLLATTAYEWFFFKVWREELLKFSVGMGSQKLPLKEWRGVNIQSLGLQGPQKMQQHPLLLPLQPAKTDIKVDYYCGSVISVNASHFQVYSSRGSTGYVFSIATLLKLHDANRSSSGAMCGSAISSCPSNSHARILPVHTPANFCPVKMLHAGLYEYYLICRSIPFLSFTVAVL